MPPTSFLNITNIITIFLALFILILFIVWLKKRNVFNSLLKHSFRYSLFLIKIPPEELDKEKSHSLKEKINVTEQLISILINYKKPIVFEIALPEIGEEISYYAAVPQGLEESFKKHLLSFYSKAYIEKVEDYNIFNPHGFSEGVYLTQKDSWMLPIKTYMELEADPISPILNAFKLKKEGEGMAIQIIITPSPKNLKNQLIKAVKNLKEGQSLKDVIGDYSFADAFKDFTSTISTKESKEKEKPKIVDENAIKTLETKSNKTICAVNVRIFSSAETKERTQEILNVLLSAFDQFSSPFRNSFKAIKPKKINKLVFNYAFRIFSNEEKMYLNTEEIASFWHFPLNVEMAPELKWVKSREAPPPVELPEEGVIIGEAVSQNQKKLVRILPNDRRRHIYTIGQTGVGKSVFLQNMAIQDIENGEGVCVIDPHGDMIETILGLIPKERFDDVVVFDPSDLEYPMGLNMLEYDIKKPEQKTFIINDLIDIFDKLYDLRQVGGPMFEYYLRNAVGLLMSDPTETPTLLDVPRVFTNADFLKEKLSKSNDPLIVEFWEKEALKVSGSSDLSLQNISPYITSKFATFTTNDYIRPIIAQKHSTLNFREIMDKQKILLVNLSKGKIGELNASLLGLILVGKILMSAFSRVDLPEDERKDFYLYIDEFQNFTTPSIAVILSEARKYRLDLIISHQFIAQLQDNIRDAVFGNVGSIVAFRVGVKDAEFLVKQFDPVFTENDLINIDNFTAAVKLLVNNKPTRPFTMRTLPPVKGDLEKAKLLKETARLKYGKRKTLIDQEIRERIENSDLKLENFDTDMM